MHPEKPERISKTIELLKGKIKTKELGWKFMEPEQCTDNDLLLVHSQELIDKIKSGNFYDPDTPNYPNIFNTAKLAAGSAIDAMHSAIDGETAFSLMRPPGHHAGRDFLGGFCYFNNIAIAVAKAFKMKKSKINKVAILDIDGHHGNGTQDIFQDEKWQNKVLYISLHQSPAYPGSGLYSINNCRNFPLKPGTDNREYLQNIDITINHIEKFDPELIAVSAGFDTYKDDPLLSLNLDIETYYEISRKLNELNKPIFAVLEGGYSTDLPQCIHQFLNGAE